MTLGVIATYKESRQERKEIESLPKIEESCVKFQGHRYVCKATYKDVELCYHRSYREAFYIDCKKYEEIRGN